MKDDDFCQKCGNYFKLDRLLYGNFSEHQPPKCGAK